MQTDMSEVLYFYYFQPRVAQNVSATLKNLAGRPEL